MRIREWYLQGQAKHYRQNILLSSFNFPELKALYNGHCKSHSGRVQLQLDHEVRLSSCLVKSCTQVCILSLILSHDIEIVLTKANVF